MTWTTIDDVVLGGWPASLTTDAAGNLYVVGEAAVNNSRTWMVRKGIVGNTGITWANVDSLSNADAYAVVATSSGLFVGGRGKRWQRGLDSTPEHERWIDLENRGQLLARCGPKFGRKLARGG